jgi:transcriptional repressor NrdR
VGVAAMRCPFCGHDETKVVDSRDSESQDAIRRRRECLECGKRFTTYERREEMPLMVRKKDGSTEPFERGKLLRGLVVATAKRPVEPHTLEALIDDIESELHNTMQYEVSAKQLGDMVLQRLLDLDKVAYIRFASVYKEFTDIDEFTAELKRVGRQGRGAAKGS